VLKTTTDFVSRVRVRHPSEGLPFIIIIIIIIRIRIRSIIIKFF